MDGRVGECIFIPGTSSDIRDKQYTLTSAIEILGGLDMIG